ncbi:dynamin [Actinomycetospora sp. NBC_00405]|uniref:dynamin n=1 Tax=Actinomycetospora sp. NBC_00405 TaxID=2975952 RepID=UPI002E22162F
MTASGRDVPAEVARTREALTTLLARLDPDAAARAAAPPPPARPTVVLAGAPARGRRELLAALLGLDEVTVGHATHDDLGVPLLEELDLVVPARGPDPGSWPVDGATAALVLADAAAPLGAEELDALARAAGRVDTVVFALTRTEAHRGWRTVLEADRALVAEHVPRLTGAPWFPVSAELARRAGTATPEAAEALRRRSGLAALQRELHRLVARRRRMLAEANALRLLAAGLDGVAARAEATRSALRAPADGVGDLARRRDELLAARAALRRDHHTRWRADLAAARVAAADDLAARVRALGTAMRGRIDDADRPGLAAMPRELAGEVETLAAAVVEGLGTRLRALVAATLADLVPAGELPSLRVADLGATDVAGSGLVPPPRTRPAEDRLLVVAGASGGLGLSRLALLPLLAVPIAPVALGAALVPVSVGLGLGAAGWVARARRLAADRAHLRQWTAEALAEVRGDLDRVLADALITTEREVTLALDAALEHRARDLDDALAAAERAVRHAGADRTAADRVAAHTATEAREGRDRAETLLRRLAALRDRVDVPEPHPRIEPAT